MHKDTVVVLGTPPLKKGTREMDPNMFDDVPKTLGCFAIIIALVAFGLGALIF